MYPIIDKKEQEFHIQNKRPSEISNCMKFDPFHFIMQDIGLLRGNNTLIIHMK